MPLASTVSRRGPSSLVGRPLSEVERYYIEQALELTGGNREEAAKMLGIGERTLYRDIKDWEQQDKIREALEATHGDVTAAASSWASRRRSCTGRRRSWGWRRGRRRMGRATAMKLDESIDLALDSSESIRNLREMVLERFSHGADKKAPLTMFDSRCADSCGRPAGTPTRMP